MKISHNTLTYLKPRIGWLGILSIPFTRCQKRNISEQEEFDTGDIRVRYQNDRWWVCHGKIIFCSLDRGLKILGDNGIKNVRILLEGQKDISMNLYYKLEELLKVAYSDYNFLEGRRRSDWRKVIDFPDVPDLYQYVGSMEGGWLGKICPWAWWILKGKKGKEEAIKGHENISLDFL